MKLRRLLLGRKAMTNLDSILKSRGSTLPTENSLVKAMIFLVVMYGWELDYKESWVPKNWCFWTVVLEKTPESPLDCKEIQPVNLKGNQPWILIGKTETEAPVFWSLDANSWLWKCPWCWERLRAEGEEDIRGWDGWMTSEDEMAGWHHPCNGHELGQSLGDGEGKGGLAAVVHGLTRSWTQLGDWTTTTIAIPRASQVALVV